MIEIPHKRHCPRRDKTRELVGKQGDPGLMCTACGAYRFDRADPAPRPATQAPTRSRYSCREHYEPVTWRGTGCTACANREDAS